jgi:hypothetical protein
LLFPETARSGPDDVFDTNQGPDVEYWANQETDEQYVEMDFGDDDLGFDFNDGDGKKHLFSSNKADC